MAIFHHITNMIRKICYWFKRGKQCPPVVSHREPPLAEELRTIMSGNICFTDKEIGFTFINKLTSYPMDPCIACEAYMGGVFRLVSYEDLVQNANWLKVNGRYLYPMVVWAIKNDKPVLVSVSPGKKKPVKLIRHSSSDCLAYIICVTNLKEITNNNNEIL